MSRFRLKSVCCSAVLLIVWVISASAATIPAAPALVSPGNSVNNQPLSLSLSWGTSAGATTYEVEVSLSSAFDATIFDQVSAFSTSAIVGGLSNNTSYYWRANASSADGTSWSDAWSFTTVGAGPAAPVPASPINGAGNQPLSLGLSWSSSAGATSYEVQISLSSDFESIIFSQSSAYLTEAMLSGLSNNITYYWRANASNAGGASWSDAWSFTTIPAAPSAPILASPSNGASSQSLSLGLSWGSTAGATSYEVEVSLSNTFDATIFDQSGAALTGATISGLTGGTTYYWRANASNAGGASWSNAWSFTTITAGPSAPVLASPASGSFCSPLSVTLDWNSSAGATSYEMEISLSSAFGTTIFDQVSASLTLAIVGGFANNTTYYWRVSASNAGGTSWSDAWNFTTVVTAPAGPALASPTNGATNQPLTLGLSWGSVAGATSYGMQLSADPNFGAMVFGQSGLVAPAATMSGLANSTTYYWRANATGATGASAWSSVWSFSTIPPLPVAPMLVSPSNTANFTNGQPVAVVWSSAAGAVSYMIQASTLPDFSSTTLSQGGLTATSYQFTPTTSRLNYWRVAATNAAGMTWSGVYTLTPSVSVAMSAHTDGTGEFSIKRGVIAYSLPRAGEVAILLCDMRGRTAMTLNRRQNAGSYAIDFRSSLAAGQYIVRFKTDAIEKQAIMLLTR